MRQALLALMQWLCHVWLRRRWLWRCLVWFVRLRVLGRALPFASWKKLPKCAAIVVVVATGEEDENAAAASIMRFAHP